MNNLFFYLLLAAGQFFGSSESNAVPQKENQILKDSIPFVCGQADGYDDFLKQHPEVLKKQNQWETDLKARLESGQSTARRSTAYEIPVVVHIIHDNGTENISDAEVAQGIQYLNEGFAGTGLYGGVGGTDTEMTFRLAERDPDNNPTTGINRVVSGLTDMLKSQDLEVKNLIRWDPTCYVNFWLVREICKSGGDCGVAGYAYFPSSHGREEDGIVMEARHFPTVDGAFIQVHEVGHYLGLYHTFQDGCKNDDCLADGDRVCDTPPDQSTVRVNCADGANTCSTDVNPSDPNNLFTTDENDQMENFMDYASCSVLFTEGQKTRMVDALENVRFSLIDTDRCPVFCSSPVTADFSASATDIFAGETVNFTDLSAGAVNSTWTIDDVPFSGTSFTFNDIGSFTVRVQIIGTDPACRDNFSLEITVKCPVEADFAVSTTQVGINEPVNFSNASINATSYEWTVNNSIESNALNFDFSFPTPGIFTVCLSAENNICQSKKCQRILVTSGGGNPPCTGPDCEDCSNGIDDNDDGLIDFFDPDCPCITGNACGTPFYSPCAEDCLPTDPPLSLSLDIEYTDHASYAGIVISAADFDGDCQTEVAMIAVDRRSVSIIGRSGQEYTYSNQTHLLFQIAAGDVDNDGAAEIFIVASTRGSGQPYFIWRLDYNFALDVFEKTWESSEKFDIESSVRLPFRLYPSLADFNYDGRPEVYIGNQIFDSETGLLLAAAGPTFNIGTIISPRGKTGVYTSSVAVDMLSDSDCTDCFGLELVAGNQVFSVDLNSTTNAALNSVTVERELTGFGDGATAIADFDMDGDLDIIVTNLTGTNRPGKLYIWEGQTATQIGQSLEDDFSTAHGASIPTIGDLDGDDRPEIVINGGRKIRSYHDYQTGGGPSWGANRFTTTIGSYDLMDHHVGTTLFDFNLDGKQEIVMRDQFGFYIFDGELNLLVSEGDLDGNTSVTDKPLILDWDDDGEAEILTPWCYDSLGNPICTSKLVIINSADLPWANTRKIQNQQTYFNTNINDDGTVPIQQQTPHLLELPALNSFNQQYALPKPEDCAEEDCLNGVDDDGDGLVDFFDPDCPCIPDNSCGAPFYSPCQEICSDSEPIDTMLFNIDYTGIETRGTGVINAADYDGDCEPEICVRMPNRTMGIVGQSGVKYTFTTDADHGLYAIASADVDNDGAAEIFVIVENYPTDLFFIWRLDYNFALNRLEKTWESSQPIDLEGHDISLNRMVPSIADFNFDGRPEVYLGNQIYDSQTGQFLGSPGVGFNTGCAEAPDGDKEGIYTTSIAVDALPDDACSDCAGLELVAGNQVFSVALNSTTNPAANSIKVAVELPGFEDGVTAVADFDLDGDLDIIVANLKGIVEVGKLYIWDAQTPTQIGQTLEQDFSDFLGISIPAIGDLDGDGRPEIVINSNEVTSFDDYQSGGGTAWGSDPSKVILGSRYLRDHQVGMTLFDFNLDGKQEIVIRNQRGLHILDENIKTIGEEQAFQGATNLPETPLIIDWDDDGEAEIITFGCKGSIQGSTFCQAEFIVINSASFKWANTRKIQNQYAYFNTNINDDGTVPTQQQSPHLLGSSALNSYNQQYAMPAPLGAEASAKIEGARCGTNGIEIDFEICNTGEESLLKETPVAIYDGNPTQINAPLLLTFELPNELFPGECITLTDTISANQDSIFVVVNDDGTLATPFALNGQFPPTGINECVYSNNISGIEVPQGNPPSLDLGPDILICDNGIFTLDAGAGFETYRWSEESFERTITVYESGKYWVETTGICGGTQTDTILIELDPITEVKLGTDLTVCKGDTVSFDAGIFDDYQWLPKSAADCDTCQIFNIKIMQDTQVIVQVQSDLGCISLDTVNVLVAAVPIGFDSIFICRGDTISVNGTAVFSDTLLSQKINSFVGCDSILNTKITVRDSILKNRKIEICAGDTAFVFGNPITNDSILTQIFNGQNTCDSTERVEVIFKNRLFTDDEFQFCEGDTAMIFGNVVTENDTLSQIFTSSIGCDSTSEIRVVFTNSINTDDELDLCAGDTVLVFGNAITMSDTLTETYTSLNGCDSTHQVRIQFRPVLFSDDEFQYCEGDTAMIFGNAITQTDTLLRIFTSSIGCDSTSEIRVIFNKSDATEEEFERCAGDTIMVFGNAITASDTLTETYSSLNGCDSTHQVRVRFRSAFFTDDEIQFCEGDTAMIFGNIVTENDTLSQIFTSSIGCDSTSEIRVVFTNLIQTDEELILCQGDTAMIFGNEITSDSTLAESFVSLNGCDSTHEVRAIFNQPVLTEDLLEFCEGDTAIVFGKTVTENDLLQEIYTAANGCDSTSKIELIFNKKSNSNQIMEFCEGDTAMIFGVEIFKDSIVSQTLPNLNGCDSTHSVEVIFNQKFETFEQLEFCVGDTAFLFGNALTKDSTISQISTSAIGCDSTHNIDVVFLAEAEKMIFDSLCTGEFLLFFNDTISETGTYSQTIPSIDGCDTNYVLTAEFFDDPIVELVADTLISIGTDFEIPLNISDPTLQVTWQPNENLSCENCSNPTVSVTEETSFEATIINDRGCSVVARINIRVVGENGIYIPTGFSPNGDSNNDFFTVFSKNPRRIDQLQIFDRWGGLLFELNDFMSNDPTIGWDGTARGLPVNSAVFVYKILFRNDAGEQEMLAGDVTVIR